MKKIAIFLFILIMALFSMNMVYAASVDIPSGIKSQEGVFFKSDSESRLKEHFRIANEWLDHISASISADGDFVDERELDSQDGELKGKFLTGKATVTLYDKLDLYAFGGTSDDMEYRINVQGSEVMFNLEDELIWGGGVNAIIYEWENAGTYLFIDGKYRRLEEADYDSLSVNGTTFLKGQLTSPIVDAKYREWQGAIGLGARMGRCLPYFGAVYSDVAVQARATAGGTTYDLGETGSDNKVGPFVGFLLEPFDGLSVSGQARFVSEQAFSGNATLRF